MKRLFVFVFAVVLLVSCNNSQQNQRVIELLEKIDKKLLDNKLSKEKEVIDSIEYKTVFVQFDRLLVYNGNAPERGNMYKKAESKVSELLNNGWQIISTSNVIYSQRYEPKGISAYIENKSESHTSTLGVNIHLIKNWKRKDLELLKEKEKIKLDSIRKVEKEAAAETGEDALSDEDKNELNNMF